VCEKQLPQFYVSMLRIYIDPAIAKTSKVCSDVTIVVIYSAKSVKLSHVFCFD